MNQRRRNGMRAALLAALLPLAWMAGTFSASGATSCEEAQAWVEDHRGELPASFQEISAFPPAYRRAIFSTLSPRQRSDFRREQLEAYLKQNPRWTPAQKEIVRQAARLFEPEFFRHDPSSLSWNSAVAGPFRAFRSQALQAFDEREFRRVFVALGTASDDDAELFPCNCNLALDANCVSTNCTPKVTGCGPSGGSRCNGHYAAVPDPVDGIGGTLP